MADRSFLDWPFFEDRHRHFAADLEAWADRTEAVGLHGDHDLDGDCRTILGALADGGCPVRPGLQIGGEGAVAVVEEGPVEEAAVGHGQFPSNTGSRFAAKAS